MKPTLIASNLPQPPEHLAEPGREFFRQIVAEYGIDDAAGLALVDAAATAIDRLAAAQAAIARDGEFTLTPAGEQRLHPALQLEKDASARLMSAVRNLHLDVAPKLGHGRPAGGSAPASNKWRDS